MNKGDLISAVATKNGLSQAVAKSTVENMSDIFSAALLAGDEVTIPGVGKLKVSVRPARTGRNPKTGESIAIPEKRVVKFTPASVFKDQVSVVPTAD
jgi:DNA-binding protein HU-beta